MKSEQQPCEGCGEAITPYIGDGVMSLYCTCCGWEATREVPNVKKRWVREVPDARAIRVPPPKKRKR